MYTLNQSVHDIFNRALKQKKNKTFIHFGDQKITYGELKEYIGKYTSYLNNAQIKIGDRVVFSSKDEVFNCMFYISLVANGITAILIDADSGAERSNAIINHCNPHSIFIDENLIKKWDLEKNVSANIIPITSRKKNSALDKLLRKNEQKQESFPSCIYELSEAPFTNEINPEDDAYILFTSGTTSDPKGVRVSYRALFSHVETLSKVYEIDDKSKIFNNLILSHTDGMMQGPMLALFSCSTLYRPFPFSIQKIEDTFDIIYREDISHWIVVPTMIALIYQFKQSDQDTLESKGFKYVISCGGKLESMLWEHFEEKFKTNIINGYGLTETVAGGLFAGPDKKSHVVGTIGVPVDCEAIITDDEGNEKLTGEHGEIWLRGSLLMSGYFNAPEINKETFSGEWLKTGDIGYKGEDGCFRIVGRKKSVIISGGVNISPEEVTEVLNTHPNVQESVTFGTPDKIWGENVVSAIVAKPNTTLNEEIIIEHCRNNLEERKIPAKIYFFK
jgi:long-chain acyl-CoA synthetase